MKNIDMTRKNEGNFLLVMREVSKNMARINKISYSTTLW